MSFIKINRESQTTEWIIRKRPTAFLLLTLVAKRAKRSGSYPDKYLEIGEAEIGDYKTYGVTEQVYRSDKKFLEINGQITTRTTSKGTIAKLISNAVFDINEDKLTDKLTGNQRATNEQLTTNKNIKNDKKYKKKKEITPLTIKELYQFGIQHRYWIENVKETHESILRSIESGDKYNISNIKLTLLSWLKRAERAGEINKATDIELQVMKLELVPNKEGLYVH